jgi:predicted  nucleic acid-binding Zn-ribbon protein
METQGYTSLSTLSSSRSIHTARRSRTIGTQIQILYNHLQEMVDILSNRINDILNEQQRLDKEFKRLEAAAKQNLLSIKRSSEDIVNQINETRLWYELRSQEIWSLKQTIHDALLTSYDGTFIWKLTGVEDKIGMHQYFSIHPLLIY